MLTKDSFYFDVFFLMLPNTRKHEKLSLYKTFHLINRVLVATPLDIFLLKVNFDKSIIGLHFFLSFILANFPKDQRSIAISSIKCLFIYFEKPSTKCLNFKI